MRILLDYTFQNKSLNLLFLIAGCVSINYLVPYIYGVYNYEEYLWVYTLMEFAAVLVAFSVGTLVWLIKDGLEEYGGKFVLISGLTFFAVSIIDLMYVMSSSGMPAFITPNNEQKAAVFFIAGRLLIALGIITAVFWPQKWMTNTKKDAKVIIAVLAVIVSSTLLLATEYLSSIPVLFATGERLSTLKIQLEYLIVTLYCFGMLLLWFVRTKIRESVFYNLCYFLVFSAFSDATFTLHEDFCDTYNLLGHTYKVTAYYFLFKAVYLSGIVNYFYTLGEMGKMSAELLKDHISVEAVLEIQMPKLKKMLPQAEQTVVCFPCGPTCFHTGFSEGRFSELFAVGKEFNVNETILQLGDKIQIIQDPESLLADNTKDIDTSISVILKASRQMLYIPLTSKGIIYGHIFVFTFRPSHCFSLEDIEKVRVFQQFGTLAIAQAKTQETITKLSYEDSLTGLPNRRFFFEEFGKIKYEADKYSIPFTVVYVDMNDLKYLNDNVGHEAGDGALRMLGDTIRSVLRLSDVSARLGGDEFAILFRHMNLAEGIQKINELKDVFSQMLLEDFGHTFSAAVGGASYPEESTREDELLGLADDRMYEHKRLMKAKANL